tara:strand:+ start:665 stop:778 length:114 start_codon:yes stop_codon:yes gene_type:complete
LRKVDWYSSGGGIFIGLLIIRGAGAGAVLTTVGVSLF